MRAFYGGWADWQGEGEIKVDNINFNSEPGEGGESPCMIYKLIAARVRVKTKVII